MTRPSSRPAICWRWPTTEARSRSGIGRGRPHGHPTLAVVDLGGRSRIRRCAPTPDRFARPRGHHCQARQVRAAGDGSAGPSRAAMALCCSSAATRSASVRSASGSALISIFSSTLSIMTELRGCRAQETGSLADDTRTSAGPSGLQACAARGLSAVDGSTSARLSMLARACAARFGTTTLPSSLALSSSRGCTGGIGTGFGLVGGGGGACQHAVEGDPAGALGRAAGVSARQQRGAGGVPARARRRDGCRSCCTGTHRNYPNGYEFEVAPRLEERLARGRGYLEALFGVHVEGRSCLHNALSRRGLVAVDRAGLNVLGSFYSFRPGQAVGLDCGTICSSPAPPGPDSARGGSG